MPQLTPKQKAIIERQVIAGQEAKELLGRAALTCERCGHGSSIFKERKEQTIREAIEWFRSPSAASDSHVAIRYIATLAEIVALEGALDQRANKADQATAALHRSSDQTAG